MAPPRAIDERSSRLAAPAPRSPTIFVGRGEELQRFAATMAELRLALIYGVAGVGKTAFMLRAGEELAARNGGAVLYHQCRPGDSVATIARSALKQAPGPRSTESISSDPIEKLARLASSSDVVLCLDDAHRLDDHALLDAMVHLASRRLRLWVCIASRGSLPISPLTLDHLVVRLGSFSPEETRLLWSGLERLYGPPGAALDVGNLLERGSTPLFVKQLFAAPAQTEDVLGLGDLSALAQKTLAQLCTFRRAVPLAALGGEQEAGAAQAALEELARRFLVETAASDTIAVHDVVRDAVARSSYAPGRSEHAACLSYYQRLTAAGAASDETEMEILYHAVACGADELARQIITDHASIYRRFPPSSAVAERDLAAAVDALAARGELALPIRLLRERIRARHGQVAHAFAETLKFAGSDPVVDYDLAEMAFSLGDLEQVIAFATRAIAHQELNPLMRALAIAILTDAYRSQGQIERATETLRDAEPLLAQLGPLGLSVSCSTQAISAHDYQHYGEAVGLVAATRKALSAIPIPGGLPLMVSLNRAASAALGAITSDNEHPGELYDETFFFRHVARLLRTEELLFRGEAQAAVELAEPSISAATTERLRGLECWGVWLWAHARHMLGQPRDVAPRLERALQLADRATHARPATYLQAALVRNLAAVGDLDAALATAHDAMARARHDAGTSARLRGDCAQVSALAGDEAAARKYLRIPIEPEGHDLAELQLARCEAQLWSGRPAAARRDARALEVRCRAAGWRWLYARARLLGAEAAFRTGELGAVGADIEELRAELRRAGYEAEWLRAGLLHAASLRARDDAARAADVLREVCARADLSGLKVEAEAARLGLDALVGNAAPAAATTPGGRLARRFHLDQPLAVRLREQGETYRFSAMHLEELELGRFDFVIDLVRRRLRIASKWIDVSSRSALVDVVRVLAMSPGEIVPVQDLARRVWSVEYHALHHHSRVTTTMSRLRKLLGANLLEGSREGYRLTLPQRWAVADPL